MIVQDSLPYDPFKPRPLPGIAPFDMGDWLHVDSAYAGQMGRRRALLAQQREDVLWQEPDAQDAAQELLELALEHRPAGFSRAAGPITCPDGTVQTVDPQDPLFTLGQTFQEDFCILQKRGAEHVLTGAVLCFPASWRLREKAGRPLLAIHEPVEEYDAALGGRVQRLFDGVRVNRPLWRFNALWYDDPELFQPRSERDPRPVNSGNRADFFRSERQCILRLPKTDAVVFSIHTYVITEETLRKA